MTTRDNAMLPHIVSAVAGFAVCMSVSITSGRREAWDSPLYFMIGIPLMCVVIFAISYRFPQRAWRWPLSMAIGQSAAMVMGGGSASLWPLAMIAMTVVSAPQFVVAMIASRIAKKRMPTDETGS